MESPQKITSGRGRGRPAADEIPSDHGSLVTRDMVIALASEQAKTASIDDISFVQLAKTLNVTPGSLHYHLGTKSDLITGILNRFYKELLRASTAGAPPKRWDEIIRKIAVMLFQEFSAHRGVTQYILAHSRFRLFQKVLPGETDYGAAYLDWVFSRFKAAGFSPAHTALGYHVVALHCLSSAASQFVDLEPAKHQRFLRSKIDQLDAQAAPGLAYALRKFAAVDTRSAFEFGLEGLIKQFGELRRKSK